MEKEDPEPLPKVGSSDEAVEPTKEDESNIKSNSDSERNKNKGSNRYSALRAFRYQRPRSGSLVITTRRPGCKMKFWRAKSAYHSAILNDWERFDRESPSTSPRPDTTAFAPARRSHNAVIGGEVPPPPVALLDDGTGRITEAAAVVEPTSKSHSDEPREYELSIPDYYFDWQAMMSGVKQENDDNDTPAPNGPNDGKQADAEPGGAQEDNSLPAAGGAEAEGPREDPQDQGEVDHDGNASAPSTLYCPHRTIGTAVVNLAVLEKITDAPVQAGSSTQDHCPCCGGNVAAPLGTVCNATLSRCGGNSTPTTSRATVIVAPPPVLVALPPVIVALSPVIVAPPPVIVAPPPVTVAPAPVAVPPAPVAVPPAPVAVPRAPVIVAPPPVIVAPPPVAVPPAPVAVPPAPVAVPPPPAGEPISSTFTIDNILRVRAPSHTLPMVAVLPIPGQNATMIAPRPISYPRTAYHPRQVALAPTRNSLATPSTSRDDSLNLRPPTYNYLTHGRPSTPPILVWRRQATRSRGPAVINLSSIPKPLPTTQQHSAASAAVPEPNPRGPMPGNMPPPRPLHLQDPRHPLLMSLPMPGTTLFNSLSRGSSLQPPRNYPPQRGLIVRPAENQRQHAGTRGTSRAGSSQRVSPYPALALSGGTGRALSPARAGGLTPLPPLSWGVNPSPLHTITMLPPAFGGALNPTFPTVGNGFVFPLPRNGGTNPLVPRANIAYVDPWRYAFFVQDSPSTEPRGNLQQSSENPAARPSGSRGRRQGGRSGK